MTTASPILQVCHTEEEGGEGRRGGEVEVEGEEDREEVKRGRERGVKVKRGHNV